MRSMPSEAAALALGTSKAVSLPLHLHPQRAEGPGHVCPPPQVFRAQPVSETGQDEEWLSDFQNPPGGGLKRSLRPAGCTQAPVQALLLSGSSKVAAASLSRSTEGNKIKATEQRSGADPQVTQSYCARGAPAASRRHLKKPARGTAGETHRDFQDPGHEHRLGDSPRGPTRNTQPQS